jgi:hypothetical protein
MTLDRIKTSTGRKLRNEALQETALPIPYDAAAMPGAFVLGTDGEMYASLKLDGVYVWRRVVGGLSTGQVFLGVVRPRENFLIGLKGASSFSFIPALQVEGDTNATSTISATRSENMPSAISRLVLAKSRSTTLLGNGAVLNGDTIATILFDGDDGDALMPGAAITAYVDAPVSSGDVPMQLSLRTRAQNSGPIGITDRVRVTSSGNVLIGNTSGTERLSVTGNIQLTDTADSFKVGTNNVVGSRKTGWDAPTGTATRTTFATSTVTTAQLAERLKALIDDLTSHGLIGA